MTTYRDNDMRHISITRNHFQAINRFFIPDDIVQLEGSIFLNPGDD